MKRMEEIVKCKTGSIFLDGKPEEKLSGGFYDQRFIQVDRPARKFDEYFALTWLLSGHALYTDYLGREYAIKEGALLIRHAGTAYSLRRFRDECGNWLEFSTALPKSFYDSLRAVGILQEGTTLLNPGVSEALLNLAEEYVQVLFEAKDPERLAGTYSLILGFFSMALRLSGSDGGGVHHSALIRHAKEILESRLETPMDIRDVSKKLGLGYENFRKTFTGIYGIAPIHYRIRCKMDVADSLLIHTQLRIKEIAAQLGYSSTASFTRQYERVRKRPPGTLRRDKRDGTLKKIPPPAAPAMDSGPIKKRVR